MHKQISNSTASDKSNPGKQRILRFPGNEPTGRETHIHGNSGTTRREIWPNPAIRDCPLLQRTIAKNKDTYFKCNQEAAEPANRIQHIANEEKNLLDFEPQALISLKNDAGTLLNYVQKNPQQYELEYLGLHTLICVFRTINAKKDLLNFDLQTLAKIANAAIGFLDYIDHTFRNPKELRESPLKTLRRIVPIIINAEDDFLNLDAKKITNAMILLNLAYALNKSISEAKQTLSNQLQELIFTTKLSGQSSKF